MVWLVRHGKAGHDAPSDRQRVLTSRGQRQAGFLGDQLASLEDGPQIILTSDYPRAFETASIIATALGLEPTVDDRLICGAPASHAVDLIKEYGARGLWPCLVGHNPQLSILAGLLLHGPGGGGVGLRTGELVALSFDGEEPLGQCRLETQLRLDEG
jgi:phosphohistidine phosphatase